MRKVLSYVLAFACLPGASFSLQLDKCSRSIDGVHIGESSHTDLGNGVVSYTKDSWIEGTEGSTLVVSDCRSGKEINVWVYSGTHDKNDNLVVKHDYHERVQENLTQLVTSETVYNFDDLPKYFGVPDSKVHTSLSGRESCACRALYPLLRNGKERFKMEPWNK